MISGSGRAVVMLGWNAKNRTGTIFDFLFQGLEWAFPGMRQGTGRRAGGCFGDEGATAGRVMLTMGVTGLAGQHGLRRAMGCREDVLLAPQGLGPASACGQREASRALPDGRLQPLSGWADQGHPGGAGAVLAVFRWPGAGKHISYFIRQQGWHAVRAAPTIADW